ncbi:MAG: OadG family protein [Deltaproteobacteria bacterium]|jgi:hypothetical protein|nr:OadG family protein [Deltaproteobacteria bacterium]
MFGIDYITNNNGWAMAVVGATTVFVGLAVLSFVISQVHKLLDAWENRTKDNAVAAERPTEKAPARQEQRLPTVSELCSIYRPLVEQLQEPFLLTQLFEKSKEMDLPHPHLSIKSLQEADVLVARGDGTFNWNQQKAL